MHPAAGPAARGLTRAHHLGTLPALGRQELVQARRCALWWYPFAGPTQAPRLWPLASMQHPPCRRHTSAPLGTALACSPCRAQTCAVQCAQKKHGIRRPYLCGPRRWATHRHARQRKHTHAHTHKCPTHTHTHTHTHTCVRARTSVIVSSPVPAFCVMTAEVPTATV
jgi:hypothetical protein